MCSSDLPQFPEMKKSDVFMKRSATNKLNAAKKKKHHGMGTGGYRSKAPVWVAMERQMLEQGITPETAEWDRRWTNYVLGHGATYDMETGKLIAMKKQSVEPLAALRTAIKILKRDGSSPTERTTS